MTPDGIGEWATASIRAGRGNSIKILRKLDFLHSPGLLYSAFTYNCGFRANSGEYKRMGLAPYGHPDSEQTRLLKQKQKNQRALLEADQCL